jgi:hypothetical protein
MEEKKKIKLQYSVSIRQDDGSMKVFDEIEIGRLKNKHLKMLPKDFIENSGKISPAKLSGVIAAIADVSIEVADEIDIEDTYKIIEEMESFFDNTRLKAGNIS